MTFMIELTQEESQRVEAAQAQGVDVPGLIRGLLHSLPELQTQEERDAEAEDEAKWDAAFAATPDAKWERFAEQAREELRSGNTMPMDFTNR